jgi:hypothetical protein
VSDYKQKQFSALENLEDNMDINSVWNAIRENIRVSAKECIGHCEAKRHKHGLMRNVQNRFIEGTTVVAGPKCSE